MQVFLIRHAHAVDGDDDAARPLSAKGRKQIARVAAFLQRNGWLRDCEFWHSPLVRARETAELLASRLRLHAKLREMRGLDPGAAPAVIAARLQRLRRPVALVGHEPHLGALASLLVTGAAEPSRFALKKGAILALERRGDLWSVGWQIFPDLLGPAPGR